MADRIRVEVDRDFAAIVPGFLDTRKADIRRLRDLLAAGDMAEISLVGHRLAGAGGAYGFYFITEIGRILENAGRRADGRAIARATDKLEFYLSCVDVVYVEIPEEPE